MQIIFDEKIGDKMTGRGSGNLNLTLSPVGDFAIKGQFLIDRGDYLFTLQNVINRHFIIDPAVSLPGTEILMMQTLIFRLLTRLGHLYMILPLDSALKESVAISCRLILKNKLMNPTVSFEVTAPALTLLLKPLCSHTSTMISKEAAR